MLAADPVKDVGRGIDVQLMVGELNAVQAYRNIGCGCCELWVEHLCKAGFGVSIENDPDLNGRRVALGIPIVLAVYHTAMVGDKIIEGYVTTEDVTRFLNESTNAAGLAVPYTPTGLPGMKMGNMRHAYDVVAFDQLSNI